MTIEKLLLILHLLAVMVWVGGSFIGTVIGLQLRKFGNVDAMARFCTAFARVAGPAFGGSGGIVLLTGIGLVGKGYATFSDLWVSIAFVGWLATTVLGATLVGRNWYLYGEELAAPGATFAALQPRLTRALRWTWIDIALRVALVVLMVWRPT